MPNYQNVTAPIAIYGVGRSGSTLLQAIFHQLGWVQSCNETLGLIFGTWSGALFSTLSTDCEVVGVGRNVAAVRAVHGAMVNALPSSKAGWVHKVAGIPNNFVWGPHVTDSDRQRFGDLYAFPFECWEACLLHCFPGAQNVLMIRNPLEIAASRKNFSGWNRESVLVDTAVVYRACEFLGPTHFAAIVDFEELRRRSPAYVMALFRRVGIDWDPRVMQAFEHKHARAAERATGADSCDAAREELQRSPLSPVERNALMSIHSSIGALGGNPLVFPDWLGEAMHSQGHEVV